MPDLLLVGNSILLKEVVSLGLGWRFWIWFVEKRLNAEQNLLDGDGRLPSFFLVQDRQTDRARRVDVRMEKRWNEFACVC